jgi:hypothetical protein
VQCVSVFLVTHRPARLRAMSESLLKINVTSLTHATHRAPAFTSAPSSLDSIRKCYRPNFRMTMHFPPISHFSCCLPQCPTNILPDTTCSHLAQRVVVQSRICHSNYSLPRRTSPRAKKCGLAYPMYMYQPHVLARVPGPWLPSSIVRWDLPTPTHTQDSCGSKAQ